MKHGHKGLKIRPERDFSFAAGTNTVPITAPEFSMAARHYPIIFLGQDLVPVVAVGMNTGKNLFVNNQGEWEVGCYIPAYVRRYPFILMGQSTDERLSIGIDSESESKKDGARSLFENGEETDTVKNALNMCEQFHQAYLFTEQFSKALASSGIVEERAVEVEIGDNEKQNLGSFNSINEEKFKELPDATFLEWRKSGFLHSVYFHLQSMNNWDMLMVRSAQFAEAQAKKPLN